MKKIIVSLLLIIIVCTGAAKAVEPMEEDATYVVTVTVENIAAVSDQLATMNKEIDMLAQLVYEEARGVGSEMEQAAVIWCVLNRVDAGYGTICNVITAPSQFAYNPHAVILDDLRLLAQDVVIRWLLEKQNVEDVGRVLPNNYLYFAGRNGHNRFRKHYRGKEYWDWSLQSPYEN